MKIVKEGLWVVVPSIVIPILLIFLTTWHLWTLLFIFAGLMIFFFRDPIRKPPNDPLSILSPADGQVIMVEKSNTGFSLFIELSFHNCHLQRSPINGTVTNLTRVSGRKRPIHAIKTRLAKAERTVTRSQKNEHNIIEVQMENSGKMWITQMVGVFARRLKSFVGIGEQILRGQKVGLIYFGSMVKLEMQGQYNLIIEKGDIVRAGSTIIAYPEA